MSTTDLLEYAARYTHSGFRVLPINPGEKRPPMREWTNAATTDSDTVVRWFAPGGTYEGYGIGLAMGWQETPYGERCVFAVDLDEHSPEASGSATLALLQQEHGDLPDTVCAATGGGGMHFLFSAESTVRNGKIGPGVDVRGQGGQILVEPTLHPSGTAYRWIEGRAPWEFDVAEAPDWLLELVLDPPEPERPQRIGPVVPGEHRTRDGRLGFEAGPADILRERWDWAARLQAAGWTFHHADGSEEHWTRPGKNVRDGASAVLHTDTGVLVVFSTDESMNVLRSTGVINTDGSVTLTPFHFYAATSHGGSLREAASAIRRKLNEEQGISRPASQLATGPTIIDPDDDEPSSAPQVDTAADLGLIDWNEAFGNHAPETPLVKGLIFPGRWTAFVAAAKSGKSTLMLHIAHRLARGIDPWDASALLPDGPLDVLYLDAEMGRLDTVGRLTALGLTATDLDHLAYTDLPHKFDRPETAAWLIRAANLIQPSVVILDGINGFVSGAEKDDTPWRMLYEFAIAPLKRAGIAVLSTDNTGKDDERGARGSTVKTDKADAIFAMRAARDEYHNHTTVITRRQARTGAFADSITLRVNGVGTGNIDYVMPGVSSQPAAIVTREDILRVCRTMEGLMLPVTISAKEAARELRLEGFSVRQSLIEAAVQYRREGHPIDMEGEHLSLTPASQLVAELEQDGNLF